MNYKTCKALRSWLSERPHVDHIFLFVSRFGTPMSRRAVQKMVKRYMLEIGVEDGSVRTIRHTMTTHHAIWGTDVKTLQEILGHEERSSTERYIEMANKAQRRALQEHAL